MKPHVFYFDHIVIISPQSLTVSCLRMSIHVEHPLISTPSHICLLLLKLKTHRFVVSLGVSGISQQELVPFATSFRGVCHSCWRSCSECNEATWSVAWRFRCFPTCFGTLFDGFSMFFPILLKMSQCWTSLPGVIIVWLIHQQLWWCYQHESQVMIRRATSYSHFQRAPRRGDEVTSNINLVKCKLTQTCVDEIHNFSRFWLDEILI